ncbi:MAG: insulinase family protein [Candidatus Blackburnbacteria bacterium]|nr:insulinase family protein [Candidatus Blackburnbacteria bacterium]
MNKSTLSNGITLITSSVSGVESCTVQVFVRAGSRDEALRVGGLAHFLEHMVFKGTSRYPSAQAVSTAADSVGAEINASTDKERTAYHLKVTQKNIDLAFDILSDMVFNPILDEREIEREKGVIIQEIAMYEDLPTQKVCSSFEELLYGDKTSLGHDIAGKPANIKRVTKNDFVEFRKKLYRTENMVISVAGKFEQRKIEELAEKWFALPASGPAAPHPRALGDLRHASVKLVTKKTEQAHLVLGFSGNPLGHKDRYVETVLSAILGGGMSSRLFTEVREKRGLAYYVNASVQHYTDAGYLAARAGVELGKVEEAVSVILNEFRKMPNDQCQMTNKELWKAREYTKGRFLLSLEDTENVSDFFGEHYLLEGKLRTVGDVIAGIDKVTAEDVYRVAKEFFVPERLNLAIVGPFKDKEKFEKILKL